MGENRIRLRWLGVAGLEIECRGKRLLVDPYVTRLPMRHILGGRPLPDADLIRREIPPADAVLISHAHFDHLFDVPVVCRELGATAYGSANACGLLAAAGIPPERTVRVDAGAHISTPPFTVDVFSGMHGRMLGMLPHSGSLRRGLRYPFPLSDYRMDSVLSFRIQAGDRAVLVWNHPSAEDTPPADLLVYAPLWGADACVRVLNTSGAKAVLPVHWEDFFSPLHRPFRPLLAPPGWGSAHFRRVDPSEFLRRISNLASGITPVPPIPFSAFALD
jgi:hypothetical protein